MKSTTLKTTLLKYHQILSSFGLDFRRLLYSLRGFPQYIRDWLKFRRAYKGRLSLMPCLNDRFEEGGRTKGEYFWQDLLVARLIHQANPSRHVDVGSRVDGFVAHVASFRDVEVFDVRPITTQIPGITFKQANLMNISELPEGGYCDSLSCLHALEHFGLGRYGDPIDPQGYQEGIKSMASLLKSGGTFYLSTPIGPERVEFNANWVFDPRALVRVGKTYGLNLRQLTVIGRGGTVRNMENNEDSLKQLAEETYNLGIFVFIKTT